MTLRACGKSFKISISGSTANYENQCLTTIIKRSTTGLIDGTQRRDSPSHAHLLKSPTFSSTLRGSEAPNCKNVIRNVHGGSNPYSKVTLRDASNSIA